MRRLTALLRGFFRPRKRYVSDDPALPFTAEEFARLVSSGRSEDMKRLAEGLSCKPLVGRPKHRATH
jgi:hypothetical protein